MVASARRVVLVGAGPAGTALAFLLARRGIDTTLLESHRDFERAFRGEGLQASGLDALAQMGLGERLARLPQTQIDAVEVYQGGRRRARLSSQSLGMGQVRLISQPALLALLADEAGRFPGFRLEFGVTARDLLREDGRVVGVRADTAAGPREFRADLVVGTDGRHSALRKRGAFQELAIPQGFDILWTKVPMPDFYPGPTVARMEIGAGQFTFLLPAADGRLQIGWIIRKGSFAGRRAAGKAGWADELIRNVSPELGAFLQGQRDLLARATLLDVVCGRLASWTAPGLLLLGDAAHPMSPVGGQGINLALRDALVAANHLCPVLAAGGGPDEIAAAARRVAEERLPEIATIQAAQQRQGRLLFDADHFANRLLVRLLPWLTWTGLLPLLLRRQRRQFAHGTVPVRLTA